jgi:hypothetical protein
MKKLDKQSKAKMEQIIKSLAHIKLQASRHERNLAKLILKDTLAYTDQGDIGIALTFATKAGDNYTRTTGKRLLKDLQLKLWK